jgi:hypothetical protein
MSSSRKGDARKKPGCLVISILCGIAGFALLVFVFPSCDADSKEARMARSLSQDRLASLHHAMSELWRKSPKDAQNFPQVYFSGDRIPKEFDGLNARLVRIRDGRAIIRLQGCMDHHLDMVFSGVGEGSAYGGNPPSIVLRSGEFDMKFETLWQPASPAAGEDPEK